jgi:flavin-dependent dehydrogenase
VTIGNDARSRTTRGESCTTRGESRITRDRFDVAVIGAGPAGAAAAIAAARAGARVLLVDRATFPRPKVCGSCLAASGVRVLEALGAESAIRAAAPLRSIRIDAAGRSLAIPRATGVAIGRAELDASLVEIARDAGVEVRLSTSARVVERGAASSTRIELFDGGAAGARPELVATTTAIVADGLAGSALDGVTGFDWRVARANRMGIGAIVPARAISADELPDGEIRLCVSRGGYVGLVRLASGEIDVAAAVDPRELRRHGSAAACAIALLGRLAREPALLVDARWRGTPLLTRRRHRVAADGILVVGDAAGYVEPFTGEGMSWGLVAGRAAGDLAARSPAPHRAWPRLVRQLVGPARLRCRAISLLLRSPELAGLVLAAGERIPRPFERLAAAVGGVGGFGGGGA